MLDQLDIFTDFYYRRKFVHYTKKCWYFSSYKKIILRKKDTSKIQAKKKSHSNLQTFTNKITETFLIPH